LTLDVRFQLTLMMLIFFYLILCQPLDFFFEAFLLQLYALI
jgi:hypothetical protein